MCDLQALARRFEQHPLGRQHQQLKLSVVVTLTKQLAAIDTPSCMPVTYHFITSSVKSPRKNVPLRVPLHAPAVSDPLAPLQLWSGV